jgi:hypothetical protein
VEFVPGEGSGVRESLADVFFVEVRQVGDDLRRRRAVGDEVHDVRNRNSQSADARLTRQHIRILRDPIERVLHASILPNRKVALGVCLVAFDFESARGEAISRRPQMRTTAAQKAAKAPARRRPRFTAERGERYTPRRLAQFLLENATDAADYSAARREVRKLGLDPDKIPHERPSHA